MTATRSKYDDEPLYIRGITPLDVLEAADAK